MRPLLCALVLAAGCAASAPGGPDGAPGTADARPGTPDARAGAPDAAPGAPDAGTTTGCPAPPGSASAATLAAYARLTAVRQTAGVGCATLVEALDTSAAMHCAYYAANVGDKACVGDAHAEVAGCKQFYAAGFSARERMAGYTGSPAFEVMAFGVLGAGAVQLWVDSVWHRTPILSPWVRDVGYGDATGCATMDFGVGAAAASGIVATWPADGQTGVPTSFDGSREGPEPPPPDPAAQDHGWPSGYPITIFTRSTLTEHALTRDGDPTPIAGHFFGHDDPDAQGLLGSAYVLYADAPLAAATTYHVHVGGPGGALDFSFTTK
jgi:hypothetical protein